MDKKLLAFTLSFMILLFLGLLFPFLYQKRDWWSEISKNKVVPTIKGVFIYYYWQGTRFSSPSSIDNYIEQLSKFGFNLVVPQGLDSGVSYYNSSLNPTKFGDFDLLKEVILSSHKRNIKVWPWVMPFTASYAFISKNPSFAAIKADGSVNYGLLDIANQKVQDFVYNELIEIVKDYDVDGINIDIEYSGSYSQLDKFLFEKEFNISSINWPSDVLENGKYRKEYTKWVSSIITNFLERLTANIRRLKPGIIISCDVVYDPELAMSWYFTDWRTWIKDGLVDVISPMIYHRDSGEPVSWVKDASKVTSSYLPTNVTLIPCIGGSYSNTISMPASEWLESVKYAMEGGSNGVLVFADVCVSKDVWQFFEKYFYDP
ncbi:MAG: family 10 glycosylhydrolase [Thermoproteota archaeon]